jgi:hypothetical protein
LWFTYNVVWCGSYPAIKEINSNGVGKDSISDKLRLEYWYSGKELRKFSISDYVATSYGLEGPGSFPSSIFVFFLLYFLFLVVFCNDHVVVLYLLV